MMRIFEALLIVIIVLGQISIVVNFAVIPNPRLTSSLSLQERGSTLLTSLDENNLLTETVFSNNNASWAELRDTIDSSLPPNIIYKLSIFRTGDVVNPIKVISNFEGDFSSGSQIIYYAVSSPNVTITTTRETIGTGEKISLYILNCKDSNGWWTTGYTSQTLAMDIYDMLSPYFERTVLVNSTYELGQLLNGTSLLGENVQQAVVINTLGEAVPIPAGYYSTIGYDAVHQSYANYSYTIGRRVNFFNWTWVSIVGYPLYYVSNTVTFAGSDNSWGIYGMNMVGPAGFRSFLQGINGSNYVYNSTGITRSIGMVSFTSDAKEWTNYYGIYPETYQTSTRALPQGLLSRYNLYPQPGANLFVPVQVGGDSYYAGAAFLHKVNGQTRGALIAVGLTRTPDIRIPILGSLMLYKPQLFRSEFGAETSMVVMLQIGQMGGD